MDKRAISALQTGSEPDGTGRTLEKILGFEKQIKEASAQLVVMPEALLGGYPKAMDFGARVGFRTPEGRDAFARYWEQAIDVPGPQTEALAAFARRTGVSLVVGVVERANTTLFCTALFFTADGGLVAKHRKLMPTGSERLIWGQGDGSTMPVVETPAGRIGAAICWENYMPLLRAAMYAKGIDIWCAPTVDEREIWQTTMRHVAYEGRCFVVGACQYVPSPDALGVVRDSWPHDKVLIRGGSVIVSPLGDVIAGPVYDKEALVTAEIDPRDIVRGRYDLDVSGHYARPDIFRLDVDETDRISPGSQPAAATDKK
ncbi:MAG: carbon-nitrogen hydrolase family protein [Alphaproteobacteria bacterium]|nr:carbon-nitrogen hydrolase family protein [Alphaproteobacteria bacterium]MDE2113141.1 carbon-nitrogen hydrolase family protein [Alphaproteobacteria bacterium]MDE2494012.1 carbon-nitrogen hydrolase family protein [Alphaproteobacteria bacterium]